MFRQRLGSSHGGLVSRVSASQEVSSAGGGSNPAIYNFQFAAKFLTFFSQKFTVPVLLLKFNGSNFAIQFRPLI